MRMTLATIGGTSRNRAQRVPRSRPTHTALSSTRASPGTICSPARPAKTPKRIATPDVHRRVVRHLQQVAPHVDEHEQRQRPAGVHDPRLVPHEDAAAPADHPGDELPGDEPQGDVGHVARQRHPEQLPVQQAERGDGDGQRDRQPEGPEHRAAIAAPDVLQAHRRPQLPVPQPLPQVGGRQRRPRGRRRRVPFRHAQAVHHSSRSARPRLSAMGASR